jgi:protein-S-isoprenylcysteine O-methyltransferase Ste14
MYIGTGLVLGGAALYYESIWLTLYGIALLLAANLFVIFYEEPALRRLFGKEYEDYCRRVGRWWRHAAS